MCYTSRGYRILITPAILVWRLCLKMNFCLSFLRHLHLRVTVKTPFTQALQKVRGSWIWWWHLSYIPCLTIILLLSLVLVFYYPLLRTLPSTFPLISYSPLQMSIRIRWPMISLSFLLPSRGSFVIPLFLIPSLLISPSWVPLARCSLDGARPSFDWSGHGPR